MAARPGNRRAFFHALWGASLQKWGLSVRACKEGGCLPPGDLRTLPPESIFSKKKRNFQKIVKICGMCKSVLEC